MRVGLVSPVFSSSGRVYSSMIPRELAKHIDVRLYVNTRGLNLPLGESSLEPLRIRRFYTPPGATFLNTIINSASGARALGSARRSEGVDVTHSLQIGDSLWSDVTTLNNLPPSTLSESYRHGRPFWFPTIRETLFYTTEDATLFVPSFIRYIAQKGCRRLVAPSEITKDEVVRSCRVSPSKVAVIPYGIDCSGFKEASSRRDETRKQLGVGDDEVLVAFAAVQMAFFRKGLDLLIDAIALTSGTKLLVIGATALPPFFRDQAIRRGVVRRIICVRSPDVGPYLASADIFALPSLHDTFALVVLEAMACGLPIILSSHVGAGELLKEDESVIILRCPENAMELARRLRELVLDPSLRGLMGSRAKAKASEMTWERAAKHHIELYGELSRR